MITPMQGRLMHAALVFYTYTINCHRAYAECCIHVHSNCHILIQTKQLMGTWRPQVHRSVVPQAVLSTLTSAESHRHLFAVPHGNMPQHRTHMLKAVLTLPKSYCDDFSKRTFPLGVQELQPISSAPKNCRCLYSIFTIDCFHLMKQKCT